MLGTRCPLRRKTLTMHSHEPEQCQRTIRVHMYYHRKSSGNVLTFFFNKSVHDSLSLCWNKYAWLTPWTLRAVVLAKVANGLSTLALRRKYIQQNIVCILFCSVLLWPLPAWITARSYYTTMKASFCSNAINMWELGLQQNKPLKPQSPSLQIKICNLTK